MKRGFWKIIIDDGYVSVSYKFKACNEFSISIMKRIIIDSIRLYEKWVFKKEGEDDL